MLTNILVGVCCFVAGAAAMIVVQYIRNEKRKDHEAKK